MKSVPLPILEPRAAAGAPRPGTGAARLDADARALYAALSDLLRVYQFRDRDRICCYDVSVTQCYALDSLVRGGLLTLNQLAAELFLDKSTASRVVDALERKRYLRRRPHPEDGRAILLEPTAAGRRLHERIEHDIIAEEKTLLAELEPEVREATTRLIARLARAAASGARVRGSGVSRSRASDLHQYTAGARTLTPDP